MSHVDELFLMFRFDQVSSSWLGDLALQTEEDHIVQRKLVKLWANFAKTGQPTNGSKLFKEKIFLSDLLGDKNFAIDIF